MKTRSILSHSRQTARASCQGPGDQTIRVWDTATGQQVGNALRGHGIWVRSVAFSSDGTRIVSGSSDQTIRVWDAATGQQVGEALRGHENQVNSVAFSSDGTRIVSGSSDQTIRVWDAPTGQVNVALTTPWRQRDWISLHEEKRQSRILWIPHSMRRHAFISHPCRMVMSAYPKVTIQIHNNAWGPNRTQIKA